MSEEQFVASCSDLAELYYDAEFDAINNTQHADKDISEKREMLWEFLGVYDKTAYRSKMTGLAAPLGPNEKFHIPQSLKPKREPKALANVRSHKLLPRSKKRQLPPSQSTPKLQPISLMPS